MPNEVESHQHDDAVGSMTRVAVIQRGSLHFVGVRTAVHSGCAGSGLGDGKGAILGEGCHHAGGTGAREKADTCAAVGVRQGRDSAQDGDGR